MTDSEQYTPTTEQVRNNMALGVAFAITAPDKALDPSWPNPDLRSNAKKQFEDWLAAHDAEVARAAAEKAWRQGAQWAAVECGAIDRQENLWVTDEENPYRLEQD